MEKISAVIITYNASATIAKCLDALQKAVDEIIIVDSLSTDNTVDICKRYNAKIFLQQWKGFGPQKNFGIQHASYDNIIALDADEVLTEAAISEVQQLKVAAFKAVYEFPLINFYFGKFLRYRDYKKRMFNKTVVQWNNNNVHEALIVPDNYPVIKLKGLIEHYSYNSIEHYISKANLYSGIAAKELFNKNKRSYLLKMLFSPSLTFFQSYILKAGFLDGMHGFVVAIFNGYTSFLKYAKLWELCRKEKLN